MSQLLLKAFQGTEKIIKIRLFEEPNEEVVDLENKKITISICDENWDSIIYSKDSVTNTDIIEFDQDCKNTFYWKLLKEMTNNVGDFIVQFNISSIDPNIIFDETFEYSISIRENIKDTLS